MIEPTEARTEVGSGGASLEEAVGSSVRLLLGAVALAAAYAASLIGAGTGRLEGGAEEASGEERFGTADLVLRAAVGLGVEAERRGIEVSFAVGRTVGRASSLVVGLVPQAWRGKVREGLERWGDRGEQERRAAERVASRAASSALRGVVGAVLDLVDIDAIVARADVNAVADRLDLNHAARNLDLDQIATRLDLDRIVARVDVDAIVRRLDLAGIAREVLDELQVNEIIRESTGSFAVETVDAVRARGVSADAVVSRVVDRLLRRKNGRDLAMEEADGDGRAEPGS